MKKQYIFLIAIIFTACNTEHKKTSMHTQVQTWEVTKGNEVSNDTTAYFPMAITYSYVMNGEENELWFYVNEETQQILYVPNDDMVKGIISYPDGVYKIFGSTESGEKTIIIHKVDAVVADEIIDAALFPLGENKTIDQKNIQQPNIESIGYSIKYIKMEGREILFATTEIPINSFQLFGFCRLPGDAKLPIEIEYINLLKKNQTLTHLERSNFSLELLNYGPNPYEFVIAGFK